MRILILICLIFICTHFSEASNTLTSGVIPVTQTGGNTPSLQNGSMTDTGTVNGAGNVGVNNNSPAARLDVIGNTKTTNLTITSASTGCLQSTSGVVSSTGSSCGGGGGSGTIGQEAVYTGTTTIGSGIITDNGTNVGIGTTSPSYPLHVVGQTNSTGGFVAGNGSGGFISGANGNVGVSSSSGYVPVAALDVNGTVKMTGFKLGTSSTSGWVLTTDASGNGTYQANSGTPAGSNTYVQFNNSGVFGGTSSFVKVSNNVGIGSITPGQALDVNGTVRMVGINLSTTPSNGYVMTSDANGNGAWIAPTSGLWSTVNTTDQALPGGNVGIGTNTTNREALSVMNGNVGIGTWASATTLGVQGSLKVGSLTNSNNFSVDGSGNAIVGTGNMTVGGNVVVPLVKGASSSAGNLTLEGSSSGGSDTLFIKTGVVPTTRMYFETGGNVGIGTLSPVTGAFQIGTDAATVTNATMLCNCSGTAGGVTVGFCTGTIVGDSCTTCTCASK